MWILVTYDINTETATGWSRLRKITKICEGFGQRVQKSVFECTLNNIQYERLRYRLMKGIDETQDSLRIYKLMQSKPESVEEFGVNDVRDFTEPLII